MSSRRDSERDRDREIVLKVATARECVSRFLFNSGCHRYRPSDCPADCHIGRDQTLEPRLVSS